MELHGTPVEVDTRKATALLAYLAVTGEAHQRDTLAALLWPDYDQVSARGALRRTLSTLNRALDKTPGEGYLEISRESIGLAAGADIWQDVGEFLRLAASLDEHGHEKDEICPACLQSLKAAAALYHEPFMAGFNLRDSYPFEEWQFFQEETLRRELSGVLEKLACGLGEAGQVEEALQYTRRWLALDTLREEAHRQLMQLYLQSGQRNAALRQYRECVRTLDQELGVAPLEETTRLYHAILNREPLPQAERRPRFLRDAPALVRAGQPAAETAYTAPAMTGITAGASGAQPGEPLIGREEELAQMERVYQFIQGDGYFATLEGEPGIGKTRLAEAFLSRARAKGARIIQARCYAGEAGLAYAPFLDAFNMAINQPDAHARLKALPPGTLAEIGRLLPNVFSLANIPAEAQQAPFDGAQARFFEALRQGLQALLSGTTPGVVFIDNLHWADSATIDLLTYLARRLKNTGLLVLAAWRNEPGEIASSLDRLAAELSRSGQAQRLRLKRMSQEAVVALVRAYPGAPAAQDAEVFGMRLYQESEGLPFAVIEYLAMQMQRTRQTAADSAGPATAPAYTLTWEMPGSVRDLLHSRLENMDAAALQLLSTAAVIGRSFDDQTLREISGRSEIETIDGLDALLAAGLVTEQNSQEQASGEIRYDFTHEKLRALIYEETSLARRRLLHRRIAETLSRSPGRRMENPGLIAYHFQQAGLDAQAAEYHLAAGERARRLFANTEAMAHFQAALAAGHPDSARLHEDIGDLHVLRGEYNAALVRYQAAASLCVPGCLANLEHKLGNVYQRLGDWDLAEGHYLAGLEALGDPPDALLQAQFFADRGLLAHARGDMEGAQSLADQSLALAQAAGDPHALAQAYNLLGVLARSNGKPEAAIEALQASLRVAESLNDPLARIAALNNLALVYGEDNNLDESIRLASDALDLCQKRGDRHHEAALHNNLADLLHRAGREEEAMARLKRAVVIFAEIGAPGEESRPEIWKLTEW
jgi:DNA-binding SARP family transcriptional activator